jgi:serine/threonine protein kinase
MSQNRVAAFLTILRESQLLEAEQVEELAQSSEAKASDLNGLARLILQKGWLTRFQLTTVSQGKTKDLMLGPYRLLDRLGEGGMGQVFKAHHQPMNRTVALKVIRKEKLANPTAVQRFFREVQAAARLVHPNIVVAFDANQVNGTHYFAMEYVDGIDLARLVKQNGPLPVPVACDYVRQAALGLQHAHEQGMVHRDIKPHNLLVTQVTDLASSKSGSGSSIQLGQKAVVKVLDMGLARLSSSAGGDQTLTQDGAVIGTPEYIPPEQALNARGADIRADLYSLGGVFFYLLTGRPPFQGGTLTELLLRHQMEAAPDVRQLRADGPADVAAIVARLLAKMPEERFQTPLELVQALEPICQGGSNPYVLPSARGVDAGSLFGDLAGSVDSPSSATMAQSVSGPRPAARPWKPEPAVGLNKGLIAALAGAAAVVIGLVVYLTMPKGQPENPAPQLQAAGPATPKAPLPPATRGAPPAVAEFTLKPVSPITLKGGASTLLAVQVERKGLAAKPIQVRLEGLPPGVTSDPVTIDTGNDMARINLVAQPEVRESAKDVQVVASNGAVEVRGSFRLELQANAVAVTPAPVEPPPLEPPPAKKVDPPNAAKQAAALALIKELYKTDYAKTKLADRVALAKKLLGLGIDTKDDLVSRFVLLREAADLGSMGGSAEVCLKAIELLSEEFALDRADHKLKALSTATKVSLNTLEQKAIAEGALAAVDDAEAADNYAVALELLTVAETAARKGQALPLLPRINERGKSLKEVQKESDASKTAEATLKDKPDDPDANLVLGRFRCLYRDDWKTGLPLLAKGSDARLKDAAARDLKATQGTATEQAAAGDAWYELAGTATVAPKAAMQVRAHYWYSTAAAELTGIARSRIDKRLAELQPIVDGRPQKTRIWTVIRKALADKQTRRWGTVGGSFVQETFEEIPAQGGLLIGFYYTTRQDRYPGFVQPIFLTEAGEVKGRAYDTPQSGAEVQVVKAKKGYAVGAIYTRGGGGFDAFKPVFMKINETGLDPKDQYEGTYVGGNGGSPGTFGGDGQFIVGIHGKIGRNDKMEALSLVSLASQPVAGANAKSDLGALDLSRETVLDGVVRTQSRFLWTKAEWTGPVEITAVARTDRFNIRMHGYRGAVVIFNWEGNPRDLRVHRPDGTGPESGSIARAPVEPLEVNTWYTLRWRLTEEGCEVWINNRQVFSEKRPYDLSVKQKLAIGTAFGSTLELKSCVVKPIR